MSKFPEKFAILQSLDLITPTTVMEKMRTTRATADNTLSIWLQKGLITRISAGCYISALRAPEDLRAMWQACNVRLGAGRYMLIGESAWKRAGWDAGPRPLVYLATCDAPSTPLVDIVGVKAWAIGQTTFNHWRAQAVAGEEPGAPPAVHPISQMTWWLTGDCPAPMSDPDAVDWDAVSADPRFPMLISVLRKIDKMPVNPPKTLTPEGFPTFYRLATEAIEEFQRIGQARREREEAIEQEVPR